MNYNELNGTAVELEHFSNITCLAEESLLDFQSLKLQPLGRELITESGGTSNLTQWNIEADPTETVEKWSISKCSFEWYGSVVQILYPEPEMPYSEFLEYDPMPASTSANNSNVFVDENDAEESVNVLDLRKVEIGHSNLTHQDNDRLVIAETLSGNFEQCGKGKFLDLFAYASDTVISKRTTTSDDVGNSIISAEVSMVNDQFELGLNHPDTAEAAKRDALDHVARGMSLEDQLSIHSEVEYCGAEPVLYLNPRKDIDDYIRSPIVEFQQKKAEKDIRAKHSTTVVGTELFNGLKKQKKMSGNTLRPKITDGKSSGVDIFNYPMLSLSRSGPSTSRPDETGLNLFDKNITNEANLYAIENVKVMHPPSIPLVTKHHFSQDEIYHTPELGRTEAEEEQIASFAKLAEESFTITGINSTRNTNYFERKNEIWHADRLAAQELHDYQVGLDNGSAESRFGLTLGDLKHSSKIAVPAETLGDSQKEVEFGRLWRQHEEYKEERDFSTDESSTRIEKNGCLLENSINFVSKRSHKRSEIAGSESDPVLLKDNSYLEYSRTQLHGKVDFSLEHSNHYLSDGFHVTSTVTYTDRLYKKMTRGLRFPDGMSRYGKANFWNTFNSEEEYSSKTDMENMKPSFTRASSIFVVYTDQNLLDSQSGTPVKKMKGGKDKAMNHRSHSEISPPNMARSVENTISIGVNNSWGNVNSTSHVTTIMPVSQEECRRSRKTSSPSGFSFPYSLTKTERGEGKDDSLKRSPAWLLRSAKPRGIQQVNVFERCERESIAGDGSMLYHADCLMRLNFFAERMTEQIAELAAVELGNRFRAELNPRARYFLQMGTDMYSHGELAPVTSSESDEENERKIKSSTEKSDIYSVKVPECESSRSSSWFSLFGGGEDRPRSPMSFLWRTSHRQSDTSSRKSSSDSRNEFMDLLRRTSGASVNVSDMSTKLPDSALAGLSNEERDHIEKVLSAANRRSRSSQSTPTASRRQSIYKLPDMNDFELYERTHIEGVIEKAEKGAFPFVIKITKADTVKDISTDADEKVKLGSIIDPMACNKDKPVEPVNTVLSKISAGNISASEQQAKQDEKILGKILPITSVVKVDQRPTLNVEAHLGDSSRCEDVSCEISAAEMEHIRKVEEAAAMMGADIQWINWPTASHKVTENLQSMQVAKSLTKPNDAEELSLLGGHNIEWRSENWREQYNEIPSLNSSVLEMDNLKQNSIKAGCGSINREKIVFEGHEKLNLKLTEESVMHIKEVGRGLNYMEELENSVFSKAVEANTIDLTGEELKQIRSINGKTERLKQSEKIESFAPEEIRVRDYQETQPNICSTEEELIQTRVAQEQAKKLRAFDKTFLEESRVDKQTEEDICSTKRKLLQTRLIGSRTKNLESPGALETEATVTVKKEENNVVPEGRPLMCVTGEPKHFEGNEIFEEKKEIQDSSILIEEELMQIRTVEQRAQHMEKFNIFERKFINTFKESKDSNLETNRPAIERRFREHLTKKELEHIKEVERNALGEFGMPFLEQPNVTKDVVDEAKRAEEMPKELSEAVFDKLTSVLNPFKNSRIMTLPFRSNTYEMKFPQSAAHAEEGLGTKEHIRPTERSPTVEKANFAETYSKYQDFEPGALKTIEIDNADNTVRDIADLQLASRYPGNEDSERMSSSDSSSFGPGTSDEDVDQNSVKSSRMSPEMVFSTPELQNKYGSRKVKLSSDKYDMNTNLSLENSPNPGHKPSKWNTAEVFSDSVPKNEQVLDIISGSAFTGVTKVIEQFGVKGNGADGDTFDRFRGLTEEEIQHIKMIDLQFELENAEDVLKVPVHIENTKVEAKTDAREYELQPKNSTFYIEQAKKPLGFINAKDDVSSNTCTDVEFVRGENQVMLYTSQVSLESFTVKNKLIEVQSTGKDLPVDRRGEQWQSLDTEKNDKDETLKERSQKVDIAMWHEQRPGSLRNTLFTDKPPEVPDLEEGVQYLPTSQSEPSSASLTIDINLETESIEPSKGFDADTAHMPIDQASQRVALAMQAEEMFASLDAHSPQSTLQFYASNFATPAAPQTEQQQQQRYLSGREEEEWNTKRRARVTTRNMFGSLSRLAGDAFKGAKQATEQLAQVAQHAASASDLTTITKPKMQRLPSSHPVSPSPSFLENELLASLDGLSEEERQKIIAVMASAELDTSSTSISLSSGRSKISASHTVDSFFRNEDQRDPASTNVQSEQPKKNSAPTSEVQPKSPDTMSLSVSTDIKDEVGLSCLSPAERNQIISVMKAAESEALSVIPPLSSLLSLPAASFPTPSVDDEFHDNLAELSPSERSRILAVMKAAQEEHFETPQTISSHLVSQNETSGDRVEENEWLENSDDVNAERKIEEMEILEVPINVTESSTTSISVTSPEIDSNHMTVEDSSCNHDFGHSDIVSRADIQETDIPSAPGSSDYGSADFDYTYGDDRRFIFDGTSHMEDSAKENQDADSDIGTLDWSDQGLYEWTERKPRMWTTVFTEEEEKGDTDMQKCRKTKNYVDVADSHQQFAINADGRNELKICFPSDSGNTTEESKDIANKNLYEENLTGDIDEQFLLNTDSLSKKALDSEPSTAQHEILGTTPVIRVPPAITVTDHDDKARITTDDDSDADTSPSSDEDDYPDQVIEVPSAPPVSYDEMEKEQEQQEAFGKAVLQQIQAFGEAANDEFDVQWAHDNLIRKEGISNIFAHDESTTPAIAYDAALLSLETKDTDRTQSMDKVAFERKNPFLDIDDKIVDEDSVEPEDVDYTAAASYYSSQSFLTHRPGPVYTIPEDKEQDDGQVNTDSKFYGELFAKEVRRIRGESAVAKVTSKSTTHTGTPVSSTRDVTTTVYSGDYYNQLQKRQDEALKQTFLHATEADAVTPAVKPDVDNFEASVYLEGVVSVPSAKQKEPPASAGVLLCSNTMIVDVSSYLATSNGASSVQNGRDNEIEISANKLPKTDSGTEVLKVDSGAIQTTKCEALPSSVWNTSGFHQKLGQPFNSPSRPRSTTLSETLGSGLDSNVATMSPRLDIDSTTTRLKRSPAMILMGGEQHHIPSTSTASEVLPSAYVPTLFSQTIPKELPLTYFVV
uniref:Uncharacterized protein n=1 Tax=Setaria digitata TaxID=48799 RepID=A0A915PK36_9BILA